LLLEVGVAEQDTVPSPGGTSQETTRENVRALFVRIAETCDLPPLPAVAARAMSLARDPDASANDLARVVATDGALAVRVLKISRSVTYLRREPPRTMQEAIVTVGFQALRKILIAASARATYRARDPVAETLWRHALATALAADELAVEARERRGGDAFIAGLLHDVGKLVFHLADPAAFARLGRADEAAERELYGATHAAVGGCLAEKWGLESDVVEAVMLHHATGMQGLAARVTTADLIAHQIGFGSVVQGAAAPEPDASADLRLDLAAVGARVASSFESERTLFE
jgi:HD-like signal output (HDOD) protein